MILVIMDRKTSRKRLIILLVCLVVVETLVFAEGGEMLLGDESDGSRALSVHRINLTAEDGQKILVSYDKQPMPFSTRQTCGLCHSYDVIKKGWHFSAGDPNFAGEHDGRAGEPWIYVDASTGTQIPISYRRWKGVFDPNDVGLSRWQFTLLFGGYTPGGGAGEADSDKPEEIMRQFVSGKLEVNCLSCHNGHAGQDQAQYAGQVKRQNLRWAPTGACEFASVTGVAASQPDTYDPVMSDAIAVKYHKEAFDEMGRVLLDIVREVPAQRCYFCHSKKDITDSDSGKWAVDEDVHLAAGLTCVDCHRNGIDHNIIRGYENETKAGANSLAARSTCRGCHIGSDSSVSPHNGRLGAPEPKHAGIPTIHFEKLSCTACHSGLWPRQRTRRVKTSRAHSLGSLGASKSDDVLPHIITPVFARGYDGKIAPHNLIWPAFWGALEDDKVVPIDIEIVKQTAGKIIGKDMPPASGDWTDITTEQIKEVLGLISSQKSVQGQAVYVCGGKVHRLTDTGEVVTFENVAAKPFMWPVAHNVRPLTQSQGVRSCEDCHATDSPFFFGDVEVDSPIAAERKQTVKMVEFEGVDKIFVKVFAFSFVFRPWLKFAALLCCAAITLVLLFYGLGVLGWILRALAKQDKDA